jgi:hypothetical protein
MKKSKNNHKNDTALMKYDTLLIHVINGVKSGIPIYKTLKKYGWKRQNFYTKASPYDIRYLNELKCLKRSKRCTNDKGISPIDTADFTVCEL